MKILKKMLSPLAVILAIIPIVLKAVGALPACPWWAALIPAAVVALPFAVIFFLVIIATLTLGLAMLRVLAAGGTVTAGQSSRDDGEDRDDAGHLGSDVVN